MPSQQDRQAPAVPELPHRLEELTHHGPGLHSPLQHLLVPILSPHHISSAHARLQHCHVALSAWRAHRLQTRHALLRSPHILHRSIVGEQGMKAGQALTFHLDLLQELLVRRRQALRHQLPGQRLRSHALSLQLLQRLLRPQGVAGARVAAQQQVQAAAIGAEAPTAEPVQQLVGLVQLPGSAVGAQDHVVAGDVRPHAIGLHPLDPGLCRLRISGLCQGVDDGAIAGDRELNSLRNKSVQPVLGFLQLAGLAAGVDHRVVADHVGLQPILRLHPLKPLLSAAGISRPGTGVQNRAEAHNVGPARVAQLAEPVLRPLHVSGAGASVDHGVVAHDVGLQAKWLHLLQPVFSPCCVALLCKGRDHDVDADDIGRTDVLCNQGPEPALRPAGVAAARVGADHGPKGRGAQLPGRAQLSAELLGLARLPVARRLLQLLENRLRLRLRLGLQ
mmetsp:Transcript_81389/g.195298  ORF Transcript_81389/g.195298 Transcript_81389/m.195298 type:complete len:447 (+) Transcript_81389:727-2067(+)